MKQENIEKRIKNIIAKIFRVEVSAITEKSSVDNIENWDSLGHMNLILALEQEFGVQFEAEQVMELLDYKIILGTLKQFARRRW
jgi:acyl carrier protein